MRVYIYGDSLMKGTVIEQNGHPSFKANQFISQALAERDLNGVEVINRARFGATTVKGMDMLAKDIAKGLEVSQGDICLIAFGGNDADHDWVQVAQDPQGQHGPKVSLKDYLNNMAHMAHEVETLGLRPAFMTMPPIDAQRWLSYCCQNGDADEAAAISWLGDVQAMYRFHEGYSFGLMHLAQEKGIPLVDVRSQFLFSPHFVETMLAPDGIHLTPNGYQCLFGFLADALKSSVK